MATNLIQEPARILSVVCSDPATPAAGGPVRVGQLCGVALTNEGGGGNPATKTTVHFGPAVFDLSVKGVNDDGNVAVAVGDALYYVDADTPKLSKKQSGYFFGYALETVSSGGTSTINVLIGMNFNGGLSNEEFGGIEPSDIAVPVRNDSGGSIAADELVYISGWDETEKRFEIAKADADVAGARAMYVLRAAIGNAANGLAYLTGRSAATQNTNGATVGDPVYLSTTAGGWTLTAPTGTNQRQQVVGRVAVVSATVGVIEFDLLGGQVNKIGTNELQANMLTGTQVGNTAQSNVIGGIPVVHLVPIAAGANGDTDVVLTHKTRVLDAKVILTGAGVASATLQVKNGANAITDAIAASGADTAVTRAGQINDANWEIAAGGTLRVTGAGGASQPAALVVVTGLRVA